MVAGNLSLSQLISLTGKRAVVTGGARGIGYAICRRLAEAGATVTIADADGPAGLQAAAQLGESASAIQCDVTQESSIQAMVTFAIAEMGGIDILVNNAGIYPRKTLAQTTRKDFEHVLEVNLTGAFSCSRLVSSHMKAQGTGGCIVNLASIEAFYPSSTGMSAYSASKAGINMLTKSLAKELGKDGIRVNAVAPGAIKTRAVLSSLDGSPPTLATGGPANVREQREELRRFMSRMLLGRMGDPDEVARSVLFLASELSSYITGTVVLVDGGYLIG